jgi:hypothetical protein
MGQQPKLSESKLKKKETQSLNLYETHPYHPTYTHVNFYMFLKIRF